MHFRRFVLGTIAALPMLSLAPLAQAQVSTAAAKTFIQNSGQQLVGIVNSDSSTAQISDQLQALVNQIVAVDVVGDYVLGRYRNVATPAQHAQFQTLFHQLLSSNITFQIKAFKGITFVTNGASMSGNDVVVDTTITRPGQAGVEVGWAVDEVAGSPKIVDVLVAGTSLRITTRNDYASVITSNGGQVSALLTAMQGQIDKIKSNQ